MNAKIICAIIAFGFTAGSACALHGEVTLDWCRASASRNYPLSRQRGVIDENLDLSLSLATRDLLPRAVFSAKATTQSDVTELPVDIPMIEIDGTDPEQYQIALELSQVLWDGGLVAAKKSNARASAEVDEGKLEVDMGALSGRVDQLFFGVLLADAQLGQNRLLGEDLAANGSRVSAMVESGVASKSDLAAVEVEILKVEQSAAEIIATRRSLVGTLSVLTGEMESDAQFAVPAKIVSFPDSIDGRPEFGIFSAQERLCDAAKEGYLAQAMPRLSVFAQTGYGKPALNMLSNEANSFWVVGARVNWAIDSLYTLGVNNGRADASSEQVRIERDKFIISAESDAIKYRADIEKYLKLVEGDDAIIALRGTIRRAAEVKYENGTISVNDLLREITAEHLAMQTKELHEIQLLFSEYSLERALGDRGEQK
jgi:outer membrane protein TolC